MNDRSKTPRRGLTRRRFLLLGAAGALGAAGWWRFGHYPGAARFGGLAHLGRRAGFILAAAVEAVLPPDADRSRAALERHVRAIDEFFTGLEPSVSRQFRFFLYALEHATLPFGGQARRFSSLTLEARREVLEDWRTSDMDDRRHGARSLFALVFLSYYRDEAAFRTIGYSGPILPGGSPEANARHERLRAPPEKEPSSS